MAAAAAGGQSRGPRGAWGLPPSSEIRDSQRRKSSEITFKQERKKKRAKRVSLTERL